MPGEPAVVVQQPEDVELARLGVDADLGAFRWLTVHVPSKPESALVLATPEMGHDQETAAAIRELARRAKQR